MNRKLRMLTNNEYMKMFQKVYPGVDKWICSLHNQIGSNKFAYLLQRTESYLVLDIISREFHDKYPSIPVYTIHDAICTYEEYLPELQSLLLGRFYEITGYQGRSKDGLSENQSRTKTRGYRIGMGENQTNKYL